MQPKVSVHGNNNPANRSGLPVISLPFALVQIFKLIKRGDIQLPAFINQTFKQHKLCLEGRIKRKESKWIYIKHALIVNYSGGN